MMNKKMIGLVLVLITIGVLAFGGFRSSNNHETMDDDMMTTGEEMMDEEKAMKDNEMDSDMKSDEIMNESKDIEMMNQDMKDEMQEESKKIMKNKGDMAIDFTLKNLSGEEVMLSSLQGEKVYVKFWASWCSICLAGLEEIDMLASEEDFRVVTIVSPRYNGEKDTEDFKEWFSNQGTKNLEVLLDEGGAVTKDYGIRAYPTSVYIGSDGVLLKVLPGHSDNDSIKSYFDEIH